MVLVRPRLTDYFDIGLAQEDADFAIPFLDEDIPLYVDPFLLWRSPSLQDQALHTALIAAFNHLGHQYAKGNTEKSVADLIAASECPEVGLGLARNKRGRRIGAALAHEILGLFKDVPQLSTHGFAHVEEVQLYVDQVAKDRVSDIACTLLKSFLIDFSMDQCERHCIPTQDVALDLVFNLRAQSFEKETVKLPVNPETGLPVLLVPKRWLRYQPWISIDDYFSQHYCKVVDPQAEGTGTRIPVLNFNRCNYDVVRSYVASRERAQADCHTDPLFTPIPVISAKKRLAAILQLPTGKSDKADKKYEDSACQLLASLLYPHLDFAESQSRTESGVLIRDLIFYNNRSDEFLKDIHTRYGSRQVVFELKNVHTVTRDHVNQLNRYLNDEFGRFGVLLTRNPLPKPIFKNTVDLWSGQRKCLLALTDEDLKLMVTVFESRQRLPLEVLKRTFVEFSRACPS